MSENLSVIIHEEPIEQELAHSHGVSSQVHAPAREIHTGVVEAVVDDQEALVAENTQRLSDLHTLLASLLPGEGRAAVMRHLPELGVDDETFDIADALVVPDFQPGEQHVLLDGLLARAKQAVGGEERAEVILQYPGITVGEDFSRVRPVRTEWLETSQAANKIGPQIDTVIATKCGRQVFEDIMAGRADWNDVLYGYLDKSQIAQQKDIVAKLHAAFRSEPAMPSGYTHPKASYVIPDARFGDLWRDFDGLPVIMGRAVADWAERSEGILLPPAAAPSYQWEVTIMDPANAERLNALFSDQRLSPYVNAFIDLYTAADNVIDSEQGRAILRDHRQQLNTRRSKSPSPGPELQLNELIREAVVKRIDEIQRSSTKVLPSNLVEVFMGNIDSSGPVTPQYPYGSSYTV